MTTRRHHRVWRKTTTETGLEHATNIGIALPTFNFIESTSPRPPQRPNDVIKPLTLPLISPSKSHNHYLPHNNDRQNQRGVDFDAIVHDTLRQWATSLEDPTLSIDFKMTRLWQSMLRASEVGRFRQCVKTATVGVAEKESITHDTDFAPNPVCTAVALAIVQQVFQASGLSLVLTNLLMGILGNAIYTEYIPDETPSIPPVVPSYQPYSNLAHSLQQQLQTVQTEFNNVKYSTNPLDQERLALMTGTFESMDATQRSVRIVEAIQPFLGEELLVLLWNATAKGTLSQHIDEVTSSSSPVDSRKKASQSARHVLQERVRLILCLYGTLSNEEQAIVHQSLSSGHTSVPVKQVLEALENMYLVEQRKETARQTLSSITLKGTETSYIPTGLELDHSAGVNGALARSRARLMAFPPRDQSLVTDPMPRTETDLVVEQLSLEQEDLLRKCEEVFDIVCLMEVPASLDTEKPLHPLELIKQKLCDALCLYVTTPSLIMDKYEQSQARQILSLTEKVLENQEEAQRLVQTLKENPKHLVQVITQCPEVLVNAITQHPGILHFAILQFTPLVKRFLKLDLKHCEYVDGLVHKYKGIQLLWGSNHQEYVMDSITMTRRIHAMNGISGSDLGIEETYLMEWFVSHTNELASLVLKRPDLLKPFFIELHRQGETSVFYKLMMQLSSTKGVQSFIRRATISTIERLTQEDPVEMAKVFREIFKDPVNQDLLHQLQSSPCLVTCLSEFHPTAIQDVLTSNLEVWGSFFIEIMATHDGLLVEALQQRTDQLEGGETLIHLFHAVVEKTTASLNLQALDFTSTPTEITIVKDHEFSRRRKMVQCLYLRGHGTVFRALIGPQIVNGSSYLQDGSGWGRNQTCSSPPKPSVVTTTPSSVTVQPTPPSTTTLSKTARNKRPSGAKKNIRVTSKSKDSPHDMASSETSVVPILPTWSLTDLPLMWQWFVKIFHRQHQTMRSDSMTNIAPTEPSTPLPPSLLMLSRAHTKTLILDIWIEFIKLDQLQMENGCLWTMTPFVCEYLVNRYEIPVVVGAWIHGVVDAILCFQDDPRVAFFATACGLTSLVLSRRPNPLVPTAPITLPPFHPILRSGLSLIGYDTFLYYAHALTHLFFGHIKCFKPECRLEETTDGSCLIEKRYVVAVASILFTLRQWSSTEVDQVMKRLDELSIRTLPRHPSHRNHTNVEQQEDLEGIRPSEKVELDDVMMIFVDQWLRVHRELDQRYKQAFELSDAGSNRIGLDQFIKIITTLTHNRITRHECILVYCDVGEELLDIDQFLQVTRRYHLRPFNLELTEILLPDSEMQELKLSVGHSNVYSITREVEDVFRFWREMRPEVQAQIHATHQSKHTKVALRKQSGLIERLLGDVQTQGEHTRMIETDTGTGTSGNVVVVVAKIWQELRTCAKLLHTAKVTQHYQSRLYIQLRFLRWFHKARRRASMITSTDVVDANS